MFFFENERTPWGCYDDEKGLGMVGSERWVRSTFNEIFYPRSVKTDWRIQRCASQLFWNVKTVWPVLPSSILFSVRLWWYRWILFLSHFLTFGLHYVDVPGISACLLLSQFENAGEGSSFDTTTRTSLGSPLIKQGTLYPHTDFGWYSQCCRSHLTINPCRERVNPIYFRLQTRPGVRHMRTRTWLLPKEGTQWLGQLLRSFPEIIVSEAGPTSVLIRRTHRWRVEFWRLKLDVCSGFFGMAVGSTPWWGSREENAMTIWSCPIIPSERLVYHDRLLENGMQSFFLNLRLELCYHSPTLSYTFCCWSWIYPHLDPITAASWLRARSKTVDFCWFPLPCLTHLIHNIEPKALFFLNERPCSFLSFRASRRRFRASTAGGRNRQTDITWFIIRGIIILVFHHCLNSLLEAHWGPMPTEPQKHISRNIWGRSQGRSTVDRGPWKQWRCYLRSGLNTEFSQPSI